MKRLSLFVALLLCSAVAMAQNGRIQLRSESRAEITKSEFKTLRAVFSYGSVESIEVSTERGTFSEIILPGTYASGALGTPELPATHELLAVPFGATPSVNIVSYTTTDYDLSDYDIRTILPHQPSVRKDQNPDDIEFLYDEAAYQSRSLAPMPTATIEVQGTMRGIRIGSLLVNPLSYNAASNTLRVFNDIEVEINFEGADYAENERMLVNTYSPYFDVVYKQMFNYRQINDVYTDHPDLMAYPVHMIVVAPESYLSTLQPWTNWKIQKGFDVNVVTTAQAGSNYNSIRSYIQNLYNSGVQSGNTPTFLILVGDVAQVPNTTGSSSQKVTDLYYGSVDGDYFPDMFYSRMSAENTNQLSAIINKILMYEQYTMPDPSYLNNVSLIAGWDNYWNPRVAQPTINYATTYYYNTAHGFNQVNAHLNQSQYNGCYTPLNTGVGFVNYTAHGGDQEWYQPQLSNSGVNSLTNTNKYFLAMGNCCLSGNFGYNSPCFGEAMIRAENKAAYSYIGSCPNTYWYEDYYFGVGATNTHGGPTPTNTESSTGVYDAVWMDNTYNTISSMVFVGNLSVCYAHAGTYSTHSNPLYYWQSYHVLGDGSIMPYRVQPSANNVSHAPTFPAGVSSFTVNAQAGSYVGISQNNVLLGAALVGNSGSVNVNVTPANSGNVTIVVTKPQRQPYITTIPVGGGGGTTYTITTSANPTNGGSTTGGGTFQQGQSCTVHATANSGYTFTNWTENGTVVSTNANYSFTVNGNRNLVAHFNATTYTITTSANPTNGGGTTGGGTFQQGQSCTVTATANPGYNFVKWTSGGSTVSTQATYSFTVNGNLSLVAHFATATYTVTVETDPNMGTVTGGGSFNYGQTCAIQAIANEHYHFVAWTENGTIVSEQATYLFDVTRDYNLYAEFEETAILINATANPAEGATITGAGNYSFGATVTLDVEPNLHYTFINWTENGNIVSEEATYSFTATIDRNLVAHFEYFDAIGEHNSNCIVYPNPVSDQVHIENVETINTIEIYNQAGLKIVSQTHCGHQAEIDMKEMPKGIYFVHITTNTTTETLKFIKE